MDEPGAVFAAYGSEYAGGFPVDDECQVFFRFSLINGGVGRAVDADVWMVSPEEIPDKIEMMDGKVFSRQEEEFDAGVFRCDVPE
jgi:hypothetical protein